GANLLFGLGRLSVAVDALRDALRLEPSKSRDVVPKAEQLRRDGHPNEAIRLFQAVLEITPDDPRAILGLGDAFIDLGDADAAEAQFTRALGKDPQNAPILFRKGELLERKGRWGAAVQYHNRAIALRWNYPDPWLAKGEILLNHARPTEALECFEKVASFEPRRWKKKSSPPHRPCRPISSRSSSRSNRRKRTRTCSCNSQNSPSRAGIPRWDSSGTNRRLSGIPATRTRGPGKESPCNSSSAFGRPSKRTIARCPSSRTTSSQGSGARRVLGTYRRRGANDAGTRHDGAVPPERGSPRVGH